MRISTIHGGGTSIGVSTKPEAVQVAPTVLGAYLPGAVESVLVQNRQVRLLGCFNEHLQIMQNLEQLKPNLLLLSSSLGLSALILVLHAAKQLTPDTKTLIVTDGWDSELVRAMLRDGAKGCVRTACSPEYLLKSLLAVHAGEIWFERKILIDAIDELLKVVDGATPNGQPQTNELLERLALTEREHAIAELLIQGFTNKEIGRRLNISGETVKTHLKSIFAKLGIRRRSQVVLKTLCDRILLP